MTDLKTMSLLSHLKQFQAICRWQNITGTRIEQFASVSSLQQAMPAGKPTIILFGWSSQHSARSARLLAETKKRLGHKAHIVVLTDEDTESDAVTALDLGADRFVRTDMPTRILDALLKALARRVAPSNTLQHYPPYQMNQMTREVIFADQKIQLTPREFRLAQYLFENNDRIMTRACLLRDIWGLPELQYNRRVDTKISHIRRKIGLDGSYGWQLKFPRGKGYQLLQTG